MSNINNIDMNNCTACEACVNICPFNAISMKPDEWGFLYPSVDSNKCVNCNKCIQVCPSIKQKIYNEDDCKCKAAMADDEIRKKSSSGGIFTLLAEFILGQKGVVAGAAFDENKILKHIMVENKEHLENLRGSKYLQSSIGKVYTKIKEVLDTGILVLFSGTPCQIAGLYSFLDKSYKNLYTVEVLCHGVPSQQIFDKYLSENFAAEKVDKVSFRGKESGWNYNHHLKSKTNKQEYSIPCKECSYYSLFLDSIALRESCYTCKYATLPRVGDITLGDFWEIKSYNAAFDDGLGTSLVLINNQKGHNLYSHISDKLKLNKDVPIKIAKRGNETLVHPTKRNHLREQFKKNYKLMTLNENFQSLKNFKFDFAIYNFWWSNNYGAALTAFAVQQLLSQLGKTSVLIFYLQGHTQNSYFNTLSEKFAREHLTYTGLCESASDLVALNKIADKFIVGSDQVFRYQYAQDACFLNFVDYDKVKIAYSASFGKDKSDIPYKLLNKYKFLLSRFDYVSVRELSGIDICKHTFGISAKQIIDPVFQIDRKIWSELAEETSLHECNYVLSYILDKNEELWQKIQNYAENKSLKVIEIDLEKHSVQDWLYLIKNAEAVITDSFHGLCFSLIFNKKVNCLINKERGAERFKSIQEILNLPEQLFFTDIETYDVEKITDILYDYNEVNVLIKKAADTAVGELKYIINIEKVKNSEDEKADKKLIKKYFKKRFNLRLYLKKYIYKSLYYISRKEKFREKYQKYKYKLKAV